MTQKFKALWQWLEGRYWVAIVIISCLIVILAFRLIFQHHKTSTTQTPPAISSMQSGRVWIILHDQLDKVAVDPAARAAFARDTLYVTGLNPAKEPAADKGLHIIPTRIYHSEVTMAQDLAAGKVPSYFKALLYDNEPWPLTPKPEKQNPVLYYQRAYQVAHAYGLQLIATPVPAKLAAKVAPYADVVDVQAQSKQANAAEYVRFIKPKVEAVKRANPNAIVLSGISTNPSAGDPTPQQLDNIAVTTYGTLVQGYWLNIPAPNPSCPRCNAQRPDIAINFLKLLGPTANNQ